MLHGVLGDWSYVRLPTQVCTGTATTVIFILDFSSPGHLEVELMLYPSGNGTCFPLGVYVTDVVFTALQAKDLITDEGHRALDSIT